MKKVMAMLMASVMVFGLAACGSSSSSSEAAADSSSADASVSEEAASDELPTVGVLIYKYDDTYISTVRNALEAALEGKATVSMQDGKNDQATQNDQLDVMISKGVDVLAVNMVDAKAASGVIEKAAAAGIPTAFFNREPDTEVIASYDQAIFIGTNAADAGKMQGDIITGLMESNPEYDLNGDGVVQYVMFQGEPDNPEAIARTQYSVSQAEDNGTAMELVSEIQICNWDTEIAQKSMEALLAANEGKIEMVIANNDGMALGCIAALSNIGYNTGAEGAPFIPVIGVDATDAAVEEIAKGTMSATVLQDGLAMGNAVAAVAMNMASGADYLAGTDLELDDTGVAVRIPYAPYLG
ncbi:galactose ABC transporter substrate-binding protein [Chakrabartyella piscis]|uniref:galactose ABC transporter substrate-binding protein n=1 Tax=Chakrabartyella piscis TaxID=2918914 RepID=UPI0029589005|nr:galactose ABC transporter substrate-binding protein [Chakrabartyella piscis]